MKNRVVKVFTVFCPPECNADFLVCFRFFFHVWKTKLQCASVRAAEFLLMVVLLNILVLRWLHCVVRWHCWHTCFLRPRGHEQLTQGLREPPSVVSLSDLLACRVWSRTGGIHFTLVLCDQSSQITAQVRPLTINHRIQEVSVFHSPWTLYWNEPSDFQQM